MKGNRVITFRASEEQQNKINAIMNRFSKNQTEAIIFAIDTLFKTLA